MNPQDPTSPPSPSPAQTPTSPQPPATPTGPQVVATQPPVAPNPPLPSQQAPTPPPAKSKLKTIGLIGALIAGLLIVGGVVYFLAVGRGLSQAQITEGISSSGNLSSKASDASLDVEFGFSTFNTKTELSDNTTKAEKSLEEFKSAHEEFLKTDVAGASQVKDAVDAYKTKADEFLAFAPDYIKEAPSLLNTFNDDCKGALGFISDEDKTQKELQACKASMNKLALNNEILSQTVADFVKGLDDLDPLIKQVISTPDRDFDTKFDLEDKYSDRADEVESIITSSLKTNVELKLKDMNIFELANAITSELSRLLE